MSGHFQVISVGLALLCLVSAPAMAEEPPVPVDPELSEPATLRYAYVPGSSLLYQIDLEIDELVGNLSTNTRESQRMAGTLELNVGVRQQEAAESTFIYEEVQNVAVDLARNGSAVSGRRVVRALEGTIRGAELNILGEILDQEVSPLGNADGFDEFVASVRQWSGLFTTARLSVEPVSIGDSWTADDLLPPQRTQSDFEVTVTATFTFKGYARIGETVAAVVEIDLETWQELSADRSVGYIAGPAIFRGIGHGYLYFDIALGRVIQGTFDYGVVGQFGEPGRRSDLTRTASFAIQLQ